MVIRCFPYSYKEIKLANFLKHKKPSQFGKTFQIRLEIYSAGAVFASGFGLSVNEHVDIEKAIETYMIKVLPLLDAVSLEPFVITTVD
jgi:hypothetical protein